MTATDDELALIAGAASWRARLDAWRLRRRARRQDRPRRAAVTALAAVSRVPGVEAAGRRLAVAVALAGLVLGVLLALSIFRPSAGASALSP